MSSDDDEKIRPYNPDDDDDNDDKNRNNSYSFEEDDDKEKVDNKNDKYCIFIKEVTGKTTMINCSPSDTIARVKDLVYEKLNIKQNSQRLMFNAKQLEDDRTLDDYEVASNATIHLILRLHGGLTLIN
jgi:ubiquitin